MEQFGILEPVDLRVGWQHEALNFTKWLSIEGNIQILCNELDIELEDISMEVSAGRYSADIVATETKSKKKVIIENQLETTDHKHLGQIITYASGLDANIVIWIAKDYNEEHKSAIDWLNLNMLSNIRFFLVKIELWKIGNSLPAPKFDIISQPNDWAKTIKSSIEGDKESPSNLKLQQLKFWSDFRTFLVDSKSTLSTGRSAKPQHYYNIGINTAKALISMNINSKQKQISCELLIHNDKLLFEKIKADEEKIKGELGDGVIFENDPDAVRSHIIKATAGDLSNESDWKLSFQWLKENGEKFQNAFKRYFNA